MKMQTWILGKQIILHKKDNYIEKVMSRTVSDNSGIVQLAAKSLSTNKGEKSPLWWDG